MLGVRGNGSGAGRTVRHGEAVLHTVVAETLAVVLLLAVLVFAVARQATEDAPTGVFLNENGGTYPW